MAHDLRSMIIICCMSHDQTSSSQPFGQSDEDFFF